MFYSSIDSCNLFTLALHAFVTTNSLNYRSHGHMKDFLEAEPGPDHKSTDFNTVCQRPMFNVFADSKMI